MRIAVYATSSEEIGMGHVVRVSHLIDLFKARGHHVDIITNNDGQRYFKSRGHGSIDAKGTKVVMEAEIAVVDHMITDNAYLQMIRPGVRKLVVIVGAGHTITPETRWVADLIIYQCPTRDELYDIVPGEKIISGISHLILHPQYASPIVEKNRSTDFVAYFGGGAPENFSTSIVEGLRDRGFIVDWVGQPGSIWARDLYVALSAARCFVGTMGMVTYEALNRGVKPIVFSRGQDHLEIAEQLADHFHIDNLGLLPQVLGSMTIDNSLNDIIDAYDKSPVRNLPVIDGKGAYRVAREILK